VRKRKKSLKYSKGRDYGRGEPLPKDPPPHFSNLALISDIS
jgi:hypothetical protein